MNVLSFSGGKDSMMTAVLMKRLGIPIDIVLFADTGLEFPEMYEYLDVAERFIGTKITTVRSEITFEDLFYQIRIAGKHIGEIHGWPMTRGCWWNDYAKLQPLMKHKRKLGDFTEYIGISTEEQDRYDRLIKPFPNRHSPLYEAGITGDMAKKELRRMDLLNPLYDRFHRLGCYLCPQQRISELRKVRQYYPHLWAHMLELDTDSPVHFKPDGRTVHDLDFRFAMEAGEIDGNCYEKRGKIWQQKMAL